ncbi:hypothetical protein INS49_015904 [Diaporthe citri]|uniref:uncharacterized protein n=1 Tax=Diaporthe citri TaxID=83186 RepID=UPI001C7FC3DF|nr:uncharacterized protein INS49_015904 [Diaporthe citri]KAG6356516.1 hypothetical protein INS49_015904 [Diaporthe citri]
MDFRFSGDSAPNPSIPKRLVKDIVHGAARVRLQNRVLVDGKKVAFSEGQGLLSHSLEGIRDHIVTDLLVSGLVEDNTAELVVLLLEPLDVALSFVELLLLRTQVIPEEYRIGEHIRVMLHLKMGT